MPLDVPTFADKAKATLSILPLDVPSSAAKAKSTTSILHACHCALLCERVYDPERDAE